MAANLLRDELALQGITIEVQGERLLLFPKGKTPPDLFLRVKAAKPELLLLLRLEESNRRALERCPEAARRFFPIADQIAIGRNLLRLDAGLDIEPEGE